MCPGSEAADPVQGLFQEVLEVEVFRGGDQGHEQRGIKQPHPAKAGLGRVFVRCGHGLWMAAKLVWNGLVILDGSRIHRYLRSTDSPEAVASR